MVFRVILCLRFVMLVDDLFIEGVNVEGWWMAIDRVEG